MANKKQEEPKHITVHRNKATDEKVSAIVFPVSSSFQKSMALSPDIPAVDKQVYGYLQEKKFVRPPYDPSVVIGWMKANTTHSACIHAKASMIAGNGYEITAPEDEWTDGFKRFIEEPNNIPEQTFEDLIYSTVLNGETFNNAYFQIRKAGPRVAIYSVNAKNIFIKPIYDPQDRPIAGTVDSYLYICRYHGDFSMKDTYVYKPFSRVIGNRDSRLYHIKGASLQSDFYGEPSYLSIDRAIMESGYISEFNINFFSNNAQPNYVIGITGVKMNKKAKEELIKNMQDKLKGIENQHRGLVMIFDNEKADFVVKEMSKSYEESFSKLKKDIAEVISTAHLMPMELLPQSGSSNFGGGTATIGALKVFLEMIIKPRQKFYENNINRLMQTLFGFDPKIRLKSIKITTEKDDAIVHTMYLKENVLTVQEVREDLRKRDIPITETGPKGEANVTTEGEPRGDGINTQSTGREMSDVSIDKY